jgi:hypothetical protein
MKQSKEKYIICNNNNNYKLYIFPQLVSCRFQIGGSALPSRIKATVQWKG